MLQEEKVSDIVGVALPGLKALLNSQIVFAPPVIQARIPSS